MKSNAHTATAAREIPVDPIYLEGRIYCLESRCETYEEYLDLPKVINYVNNKWVKTGWSSDRNYACYKLANGFQLALEA